MKNNEKLENKDNRLLLTCEKCNNTAMMPTWWDEHGYGYSTKLAQCPQCGNIIIIKYIKDHGLDINNDIRYYRYK